MEYALHDARVASGGVRRRLGKTSVLLWKWFGLMPVCQLGVVRNWLSAASLE